MKSVEDILEARIAQALERVPEVAIPADFAARVAAKLPKRKAAALHEMPQLRTTRFGQIAAAACVLILIAAMLLLASRANAHSVYSTVLEWTLCGQFLALAMWLGVWRRKTE